MTTLAGVFPSITALATRNRRILKVANSYNDPWWSILKIVGAGGAHLLTAQVEQSTGTFPDAFIYPSTPANSMSYTAKATFSAVSMSASVSVYDDDAGDTYGGLGSGVRVNETVKLDSRDIRIGDLVTAANDPVIDPTTNTVTQDANGDNNYQPGPQYQTDHEDTVYSYYNCFHDQNNQIISVPLVNWIDLTAYFAGDWHWKTGQDHDGNTVSVPDVVDPDTWSWSPNESEDTWDYGEFSMPYASNFSYLDGQPVGQDAPQQYHIGYSAADNTDGATRSPKLTLTVHDPVEQNYPDHLTSDFLTNERQVGAQWISPGYGQSFTLTESTPAPYNLTVSLSAGPATWIAKLLGINLSLNYSGTATGGSYTVTDVQAGYATWLVLYDAYDVHKGKVDQWGTDGYEGTAAYSISVPYDPPLAYGRATPVLVGGSPH